VYYLPQPVSPADLVLMRIIDELHLEHPFMGERMLRDQLARQGIHAGRRHSRTLMLRMGIEALTPQPGTSKAAPGHKVYPYLLRKLAITRANQVWALDTTYIPMAKGFVYLTAVVEYERVYLKVYDTVSAARADIADYLDWYNTQRPHSSVEHLTPDEKYLVALPPMKMAA
jgi:transposase InsO family protein